MLESYWNNRHHKSGAAPASLDIKLQLCSSSAELPGQFSSQHEGSGKDLRRHLRAQTCVCFRFFCVCLVWAWPPLTLCLRDLCWEVEVEAVTTSTTITTVVATTALLPFVRGLVLRSLVRGAAAVTEPTLNMRIIIP